MVNLVNGVQCYELFGGKVIKNHAFLAESMKEICIIIGGYGN